jgi:ankyrin repeat domain-containing protein 50
VVAAVRPLSLKEIAVVLYITQKAETYEDLELQEDKQFKITIRHLCGLFVTIVNNRVFLIHQTAKEFLIKPPDIETAFTGSWKHLLDPKQSNLNLTKYCLWYLLFKEFGTGYISLLDSAEELFYELTFRKSDSEIDKFLSKHHFLDYCVRNWTLHFKAAETVDEDTVQLAFYACDVISEHFTTWFAIYWRQQHPFQSPPNNFPMLFVAAYFGLESIVQRLLKNRVEVDSKDSDGRTPLSWARNEAVVQLLLENGAEVDSKDNNSRTPLLWAAMYGNKAVVQLLLENSAEVDSRDSDGRTPLSWAVEHRKEAIVQLLLEKGAEADSKDNNSRTPLWWAVENGDEAVVRLLQSAAIENIPL